MRKPYVKYPRTNHLPWSPGVNDDDRVIPHLADLETNEVIVTIKMDGENTSMYRDHFHARSVDSRNHPSRNWVKAFWGEIAHEIPEEWRICGENVYAKHSISYDNLSSYFFGFSIWNEKNICLGWDETLEWFDLLGIQPVPILYRGKFDPKILAKIWATKDPEKCEGYVVRSVGEIPYAKFRTHVGKFVRKGHVQSNRHWAHGQPIVPNKLATQTEPTPSLYPS